jgi:hypothetical protein
MNWTAKVSILDILLCLCVIGLVGAQFYHWFYLHTPFFTLTEAALLCGYLALYIVLTWFQPNLHRLLRKRYP